MPKVDLIRFDFESKEHISELTIAFEESLDYILDLIFHHQSSLSKESWPTFLASLIELSPRIVSLNGVAGEYDDEDTVITNLDDGVAALHEFE
ncbi:hypothetical protein [Actinomadura coerulea]|uniref:hypothetical protein n=1 Tax=Actinomadura coerulea TaxID=46159 RepID=UPI00343C93AA